MIHQIRESTMLTLFQIDNRHEDSNDRPELSVNNAENSIIQNEKEDSNKGDSVSQMMVILLSC